MSKRTPKLPQQWPGHAITSGEVAALLANLREDQASKGTAIVGERLALTLLDQSPAQLAARLSRLDGQAGVELTDAILAAEESLTSRLKLVKAAFARMVIVSGAVPSQAEGGADV